MAAYFPGAIILHEKLTQREIDKYIVTLALALMQLEIKTTIVCTDVRHCAGVADFYNEVEILTCGTWIPSTIFGFFENAMSFCKAVYLACQLAYMVKMKTPPKERPQIILHDLNVVAALILKIFVKGKIFYIKDFLTSRMRPLCYDRLLLIDDVLVPPSTLEKLTIKLSTGLIVPSFIQANIVGNMWPHCRPIVLPPAVNMGVFTAFHTTPIKKLIPDMHRQTKMFLCVGHYNRKSNFKLVIDSFFLFMDIVDGIYPPDMFKLVIAGHCSSPEEDRYYLDVYKHLCSKRGRIHCVTLLNRLPVIYEKILMDSATLSIHSGDQNISTDFLLKSMYMELPIVAANTGEAARILTHKLTAMIVDPTPVDFARAFFQLYSDERLMIHLTTRAKRIFDKKYSFKALVRKVKKLLCLDKII